METLEKKGKGSALLPFLLFIVIYLGAGLYFQAQGVEMAFYQFPSVTAMFIALLLAFCQGKGTIDQKFTVFAKGAANENVLTMLMIYILAGAFSTVASAMGGVDATVNLGLSVIPVHFLAAGVGAISSALWTSVVAGDEIVADETLYGCTYALLNHGMTKFGVKVTLTDLSDIENLKKNLTDKTRVVYFETPCNPTLKLLDIELIAKTAHAFNPDIRVIVDNTFCTPYLQRPLELGADVVVHSATKYLNGHGDVIAGIVVGKADFISQCRMFGLKDMTGAVLSPFDAFLMARGLKTLDIRMERHCANAQKVAAFFTSHPAVAKVYYPGLDTFPGHEIAAKQMKLPGGMISIELKADRAAVAAALNKLQLCTIAVSLGDAETLVEHPATMTHSTYSAEELAAAGISEGLVRISVGLEDPEDIIDDFKTVLDTL